MRLFPILILSLCLIPLSAFAQSQPVATVVKVEQTAYVERDGRAILLRRISDLFSSDTVVTQETGLVLIRFGDDTRIAVGPNSRLEINNVVIRQRGPAEDFAITAVAGAFRFLSGDTPKETYALTTPVASIGVRGTVFDLHATEDRADILLLQGRIRYCLRNGECSQLDAFCGIISAMRESGLTRPRTRAERDAIIREYFPFVRNQNRLIRNFRQNVQRCGAE